MRTRLAFLAALIGAWGMLPGAAAAFQETPVAPPAFTGPSVGVADQALTFDAPAAPKSDGKTAKAERGFGALKLLPKLNFGLELLYGPSEPKVLEQHSAPVESSSPTDDVTILGTVKRRF